MGKVVTISADVKPATGKSARAERAPKLDDAAFDVLATRSPLQVRGNRGAYCPVLRSHGIEATIFRNERIRLYAVRVGYHFRDDVPSEFFLHDVTKAEVIEALAYPRRWPQRVKSKVDAQVLQIFGRQAEGQAVAVVVIQIDRWDWLVYAARPLKAFENTEYTVWEAQQ